MTKLSDRDRVLGLLIDVDGLSNVRVKTELNLSDDRYQNVRQKLIDEGMVEKYVCYGGGVRLTKKGEKEITVEIDIESSVEKESDLYDPFLKMLQLQIEEDESKVVVCPTHSLKARGQWQNPDVTSIEIESYKYLRKQRVVVTTYEIKQFPRWSVGAVYEAASHHRFSHQAYVVLEWPKDVEFSILDTKYKLNQLSRECVRHGVGLATLEPYYKSYRLHSRLEPKPFAPQDEAVDSWLEYVFSRLDHQRRDFEKMMQETA
jgi:predicted transcriptional regulator